MASTVFAVPLAPGKTEAWKQAVAEINGVRKNDYIQARKNLGITKEVVSLQQTPHGDMVVVYVEASDVSNIMQKMVDATDSFHQWFVQTILQDTHGIDTTRASRPSARRAPSRSLVSQRPFGAWSQATKRPSTSLSIYWMLDALAKHRLIVRLLLRRGRSAASCRWCTRIWR